MSKIGRTIVNFKHNFIRRDTFLYKLFKLQLSQVFLLHCSTKTNMLSSTDREKDLLSQLRGNLSDVLANQDPYRSTDGYLTTWLRHKDHNLTKAEAAYRKNAKWREENNIDQIHKEIIPNNFAAYVLYELHGVDKVGNPVVWAPVGKYWDFGAIIKLNLTEEFERFGYQLCEVVDRSVRNEYYKRLEKDGQIVWQFTIVIDCEGFSIRDVNTKIMRSIKNLASAAETNWPHRCASVTVINAPRIATILYNVIKVVLSDYTKSIFQMYSSRNEWEKALKERISAEYIPICYGGNRKSLFDK